MTVDDPFVAQYLATGLMLAERQGFAIAVRPGQPLDAGQRQRLVENRSGRAVAAVTDLQQWLVDDSPQVRQAARSAIDGVLQLALGGQSLGAPAVPGRLDMPTRLLRRMLRWHIHPDLPEPWWTTPHGARTLRRAAIITVLATAVGAATALALGQTLWVLALLAVAGLADVFDGALARTVPIRNAHLRWASCVTSHATDMVLLAGIAVVEHRTGHGQTDVLLAGAMLATLFASLVRVSALQAGYAFWRSRFERAVRWCAVICYVLCAAVGLRGVGAGCAIALLSTFALFEFGRVLRGAARVSAREGRLLFRGEDETVQLLSLGDSDDAWRECRLPLRLDHPARRTGAHAHEHTGVHRR